MRRRKIEKLNIGFNIGDKVIVNNNYIYYSYTQFVKRHFKFASRYQYKRWIINEKNPLTVLGVYNHVMDSKFDENKYVVVLEDEYKRIYLAGENGVKKYH